MKLNEIRLVQVDGPDYDIPEEIAGSEDAALVFERVFGMSGQAQELLCAIFLDIKDHVVGIEKCQMGDDEGIDLSPKEIFKRALLHNANSVIVAHNHPSLDPLPSKDDLVSTNRLINAASILGMHLKDHIVIGGSSYLSLFRLSREMKKRPDVPQSEIEKGCVCKIPS